MNYLAIGNIGWRFYIIFAVLNLTWTPFIWYFYVETAGLSFEEVDSMFKIKYHCGKTMTYEEASFLAREESTRVRFEPAEKGSEKVSEVEIVA